MKRLKNGLNSLSAGAVMGVALLCFSLSSCVKNDNSTVTPPTALMTVIDACVDEPAMDFYLNGDKVNPTPLTYGTGIDYFSAIAAQRTVNFYPYAAFSPIIATATVTLEPNVAYSLFLDSTSANPGTLFLTDSLIKPISGKAGVRFVDLSPDAPAVDLAIQGGSTITSHKLFKGYSSFTPVTGQSNLTLQVLKSGTSTVLATLSNVTMTNGYLYTVMFEGLNSTTNAGDKLNVIMITNAYFN